MPFSRYVEIGRVALISYGPEYGKLVVITDVVDQNRVRTFKLRQNFHNNIESFIYTLFCNHHAASGLHAGLIFGLDRTLFQHLGKSIEKEIAAA